MNNGFVYFIRRGKKGPIKIGFTYDVSERRRALQTGCAERLHIMAVAAGTRADEEGAHEKLKRYRMRGEWFQPAPAVLEAIRKVKADPDQGLFDLVLIERE